MSPTAPHLAELTLRTAKAEDVDEFLTAGERGFHQDHHPERWGPDRALFEPSRSFGFAVDGRWISTCGAFSRVLTVPGGAVPAAAVTCVAVQSSYRRRGLLTAMMRHQLEDVAQLGTEPVAVLWASESGIYGRFGYGPVTSAYRITGSTRTQGFRPGIELGEGSVGEVDREEALPIIAGVRDGVLGDRVGSLNRTPVWTDERWDDHEAGRRGASAYRFVLHYSSAGQPDGYAAFRVRSSADQDDANGQVQVVEIDATNGPAYAALWRFVLDLDLVQTFIAEVPVDVTLRQLTANPRTIKAELRDGIYVRLVDVRAALEARTYGCDLDVVIGVRDRLLPTNHGSIRLQAGPDGAVTATTRRKPDLTLDVRELGAIYLGQPTLGALHEAGVVTERTPGSVAAMNAAFTTLRAPFCNDHF